MCCRSVSLTRLQRCIAATVVAWLASWAPRAALKSMPACSRCFPALAHYLERRPLPLKLPFKHTLQLPFTLPSACHCSCFQAAICGVLLVTPDCLDNTRGWVPTPAPCVVKSVSSSAVQPRRRLSGACRWGKCSHWDKYRQTHQLSIVIVMV